MTSWRRAVPLLASATFLFASCGAEATPPSGVAAPEGSTSTQVTQEPSAPPSTRSDVEAVAGASMLLTFKAPAIGGGQVDASTFQGRPTLLWFWAPW